MFISIYKLLQTFVLSFLIISIVQSRRLTDVTTDLCSRSVNLKAHFKTFLLVCFNVITFIASLLRGTTQENMTSQRERTVGEMT